MKRLTDEDRERIGAAVEAAESRTGAEIVPVVVAASGRYDRAEDLAGLAFGTLALTVVWFAFPVAGSDDWGARTDAWALPRLLAALVAGFAVGARLAAAADGLRRPLVPAREMESEVAARASQAFFDRRLHQTSGGTGLLLFVSLFERRAVVLADAAVLAALGQEGIDALRDRLTAELRRGSVHAALVTVIADAATRLEGPLPAVPGDGNELPDVPAP